MDDQDIFRRLLWRVGLHELSVAPLFFLIWVTALGLTTYTIVAVLTLLRPLIWVSRLATLIRPVRAWERAGEDATDAQLHAASQAALSFERSFLATYVALFIATLGGATAAGTLLPIEEIDAGRAEQLIGWGLIAAAAAAEFFMTRASLSDPLDELCSAIAEAADARGIELARPPRSLQTALISSFVVLNAAAITLVMMVMGYFHVLDKREHALEHSQRLVELSVHELRAGEALRPEVELLEPEYLPQPLAEFMSASPSAAWTVYDPGTNLAFAAAPLPDGRLAVTSSTPDEQVLFYSLGLLAAVLGFAVPIGLTGRQLASQILGPLERVDAAAQQLAEEGNFTSATRIYTSRDDEVGRLAANFNEFTGLLAQLGTTAELVAQGDLRVEFESQGALHASFAVMLGHLRGFVTSIRQTSLELASAAAELMAMASAQASGSTEQSATMEAVNASVSTLAQTAREIAESSAEVLSNAQRAAHNNEDLGEEIDELRRRATSVSELLELIREIADRSDLLALNGSLEAVRAGEAGRGFALVAAEMRRLAERTATALAEVRERLSEIDAAGASTLAATLTSRELAAHTERVAQEISEATGRHEHQTRQASAAVREASERVTTSAAASQQAHEAAEGLREQAEELMGLTDQFQLK